MKELVKARRELLAAGRWDIDFHLEPEGIKRFPDSMLRRVSEVALIAHEKRDPTAEPDASFEYIDIASVDVTTGTISNPQTLTGDEAPSRARKVVRAYDIVVSTCRPTRGAIAVVPVSLHNHIASTAFSVVRAKEGVNPFYLHYALRLDSTLEQFRKWSTGSSYPAILDDDVEKTLIPVPSAEVQEAIALSVMEAFWQRDAAIRQADAAWRDSLETMGNAVAVNTPPSLPGREDGESSVGLAALLGHLADLPPLRSDGSGRRRRSEVGLAEQLLL